MTLDNDKDLKSKNGREKKVYIREPRISIKKENFKSKPKNVGLKTGLYFGVTLIQAVVSKMLKIFCKIF